jgi:hypothetical protein
MADAMETPQQLDESLRVAWNAPERLPDANAWLATARSEGARAQYGYLVLKKHLARAHTGIQHDELPATWFSFVWLFNVNVDELLRQAGDSPKLTAMLKELLAEVIRFTQAFSGQYFTDNLYELLKRLIEDGEAARARLEPVLPPDASAKMSDLIEMLWRERDDDRRRADEGFY